jgi:hypothetical protein
LFLTDHWLTDILSSYTGPRYDVHSIIEWLAARLSTEFASNRELLRLPLADRRLSLMGTGFAAWGDRFGYVNVLVTNFQDADTLRDAPEPWREFKTWWWTPKRGVPNATHVQRIGAWPATTLEDLKLLREALERDAAAEELVGIGVGCIRAVADRRASGETVGKNISSIVISRDGTMTARFDPSDVLDFVAGVNQVVLLPTGSVAFRDVKIRRVTPTGDTRFVPKIGRNKRCPCGSGKKYKSCHGRS